MRVKLSGRAERDLVEIYAVSFLRYGSSQADAYVDALRTAFIRLSEAPRLARLTTILGCPYRRWEQGRHVVIFREIQNGILVVRILHARMDPARHLPRGPAP